MLNLSLVDCTVSIGTSEDKEKVRDYIVWIGIQENKLC